MSLFMRITLLSVLCMIVAGVQTVRADMYVYRDALGQRNFTNLQRKIPLKYRSRARLILVSKGPKKRHLPAEEDRMPPQPAVPALAPASPLEGLQVQMTQMGPPVPQQTVVTVSPPPRTAVSGVPTAPFFAQAQPISTSQYGLLKLRMTEPEVLQRLGPPTYVLYGRSDYRNIWYYPGSVSVPSTQLTFISGKLTNMQRGFTEVR